MATPHSCLSCSICVGWGGNGFGAAKIVLFFRCAATAPQEFSPRAGLSLFAHRIPPVWPPQIAHFSRISSPLPPLSSTFSCFSPPPFGSKRRTSGTFHSKFPVFHPKSPIFVYLLPRFAARLAQHTRLEPFAAFFRPICGRLLEELPHLSGTHFRNMTQKLTIRTIIRCFPSHFSIQILPLSCKIRRTLQKCEEKAWRIGIKALALPKDDRQLGCLNVNNVQSAVRNRQNRLSPDPQA